MGMGEGEGPLSLSSWHRGLSPVPPQTGGQLWTAYCCHLPGGQPCLQAKLPEVLGARGWEVPGELATLPASPWDPRSLACL